MIGGELLLKKNLPDDELFYPVGFIPFFRKKCMPGLYPKATRAFSILVIVSAFPIV
jgi:hypothetical protein